MKHLSFEPKWFIVLIFFVTGTFIGGLGLYAWIFNDGRAYGISKIHPGTSEFKYINPLLAVDITEKKKLLENTILSDKIQKIFDAEKKKKTIVESSYYYRELETGHWAAINQDLKFSPGKILKIPLMIAYLKTAEENPNELNRRIVYKTKRKNGESAMKNGATYTVEEMIYAMFNDEDDDAAGALFDNADQDLLNEIYTDLGIEYKESKENDDYLSIKTYSLLLRILYNATYLNRAMSEKAMEILNDTSSGNGIAQGLPNDLNIVHRYRTRLMSYKNKNATEMHDCGIVYYSNHTYLLCTMAIGYDNAAMSEMFRNIGTTTNRDLSRMYISQ